MPVLDISEIDFSREHTSDTQQSIRRVATVRNEDARAVLHVGLRSPMPWLDLYPAEFALAPLGEQTVTLELRPDLAGNGALSATTLSVFGQYLALNAADAEGLPADVALEIPVTPPITACPHCGAELADGVRECRRCGERIRLCPVCGTPNTWLARVCRLSAGHVLRTEADWRASPGGGSGHALAISVQSGIHLSRLWSTPSFPPTRGTTPLEWSAPLAAFGLVVAAAIDTDSGRSTIHAFETGTGAALWEFDLPDGRGIYPDRGGMSLSPDGTLYAATLGGSALALDVIRGTRRWAADVAGAVYGGLATAEEFVLVPAGSSIAVLAGGDGALVRSLALGGRLDTSPAYAEGVVYAACDDRSVYAFNLDTGALRWRTLVDGEFDAAPLVAGGFVYAATQAGTVYGLDAVSGAVLWRTSVSGRGISAAPALSADRLLFVPADDGFLHIIAAASGNLIRSRRISTSPVRTAPVCRGSSVFAGADDGNVYALDADYAVQRAYETTPGARIVGAGPALYGDILFVPATNGLLYALRASA